MTLPPSLSSVEPPTRTAAAERMRRHRQRRRDGPRCLVIELRETEIDALIRKGLLKPGSVTIRAPLSTRYMPTSIILWGRHRDAKQYNYLFSYRHYVAAYLAGRAHCAVPSN